MGSKNTSGFTLVELIVSITILAVLGTIAYISLIGYSTDARNSSRVSDMKLIEKALSLFISVESAYPIPDEPNSITYSGSLAWTQGLYSTGMIRSVGGLTQPPLDPLTDTLYSYSVTNDRTQYQLGGIMQGGLFSYSNPLISQTYAVDNSNITAYTFGDYSRYDIGVTDGVNCSVVTVPSILLSDIPAGGAIVKDEIYTYSYRGSSHLPYSYTGSIDITSVSAGFRVVEVLDDCVIDTISELELYVAQLATAYQQLASDDAFEELIFNYDTASFQLALIDILETNNIQIADTVIAELNAPLPDQVLVDTFTDTTGSDLILSHTPDSASGSWSQISGSSAYTITTDKLTKVGSAPSLVSFQPDIAIADSNYSVSFDIDNLASGSVFIYLRYVDADNYYAVEIDNAGYQITQSIAGSNGSLETLSTPILNGSNIRFSIFGNTPILEIDDIEQTRVSATNIVDIGIPVIYLENSGAQIDNYTFTYK